MRTPPCKSCPWRVGADADAIPGFDMAMAEDLRLCVSGAIGAPIFACHQSREGDEIPCQGFLAVEGYASLTVRIGVSVGTIDPDALGEPPEDWPELYGSFEAMLANLRDTFDGEPTPEAAEAHARMIEHELARRPKEEDGNGPVR